MIQTMKYDPDLYYNLHEIIRYITIIEMVYNNNAYYSVNHAIFHKLLKLLLLFHFSLLILSKVIKLLNKEGK